MNVGMTFCNTYSEDMAVSISNIKRPLLPALRKRKLVIGGKHGAWDFGGNTYDERTITVDCFIQESSIEEIRMKAREIALWLSGKGALIFDDEPDKYYVGRIYSNVDPEQIIKYGKFTVTFECEPFAYYILETDEDVLLDSDVILDSNIRLNSTDFYTFHIAGAASFEVENFGTFEVRPLIDIAGSFTNLSISIGGKTLTYSEAISSETVTIDNDNYTVQKGSINKLSVIHGDINSFLKLAVSSNTITVNGTDLNCTITFIFRPLFL